MTQPFTPLPGKPYPLGATWDGGGVNFAIFSQVAEQVELCFFDAASGATETARVLLVEQTDGIWHTYLPEIRPGQIYGYRIHGPFDPAHGRRCDPHKLLVDPYALAITGPTVVIPALYPFSPLGNPDRDLHQDGIDSAPAAPKGVVVDQSFAWGDDCPPGIPWSQTVLYEAHTRGFTILNEALPQPIRGTYAALGDARIVSYLQELGVTAVELLPVHQFMDDWRLAEQGQANYWGYNTLGFFAPHGRYAAGGTAGEQVAEFKTMVRTLHRAGLEVILDVVYNHTAEADQYGPTLSLRGIDNRAYYLLEAENPRRHIDVTGTGNTLNLAHPRTLQLVLASLRYWVSEMHVDGFRFDLAPALTRGQDGSLGASAFLDTIAQDPILSQVKLIAEPWDVGPNGYQVGNFPIAWSEWNDKYRDTVRRFWRGDDGQIAEIGYRLTGSSDLFGHNGRRPRSSLNFIAAHDGFTMRDLVSYNEKHNAANGEDNRDGHDNNNSANYGVEGPTDDPAIRALRARQIRNLLTTLAISQGVPMLLHGDEFGRTQGGNNNAYCQDNPLSWQPWQLDDEARDLLAWTRRVLALRRDHPLLRRRDYFHYRPLGSEPPPDIIWLHTNGAELSDAEWRSPQIRTLGLWLNGMGVDTRDPLGKPEHDDTLLLLLNASDEPVQFHLPLHDQSDWNLVLDSARPAKAEGSSWPAATYPLAERAVAILRKMPGATASAPRQVGALGVTTTARAQGAGE